SLLGNEASNQTTRDDALNECSNEECDEFLGVVRGLIPWWVNLTQHISARDARNSILDCTSKEAKLAQDTHTRSPQRGRARGRAMPLASRTILHKLLKEQWQNRINLLEAGADSEAQVYGNTCGQSALNIVIYGRDDDRINLFIYNDSGISTLSSITPESIFYQAADSGFAEIQIRPSQEIIEKGSLEIKIGPVNHHHIMNRLPATRRRRQN
ncbi:hypothetical protein AOQ84DRAFT_369006, partial [Glonium stellatum]